MSRIIFIILLFLLCSHINIYFGLNEFKESRVFSVKANGKEVLAEYLKRDYDVFNNGTLKGKIKSLDVHVYVIN